jgi:hypothetical protein
MEGSARRILGYWRLHVVVLALVVISELIYIRQIPVGPGAILLLPLLFSFAFGALLNPNVTGVFGWLIREREVRAASPLIVIAILPFMAKLGTLIGPSVQEIIAAGPALILQELGNFGTVLLAFPVAIFLLGMGREAIGASFSIDREPNIAIISERYGLDSKEGTGVMGVYIVGTLFGTIFFAILASLVGTLGLFHPYALAMACGVGSGSMMASCSGTLTAIFPEMERQIVAFASASNLLTDGIGLYFALFVTLPVTEALYRRFGRREEPEEERSVAGRQRVTSAEERSL